MVRTQVLLKSAVIPSIQCHTYLRLCTVDMRMMGLGVCCMRLQHLDLVVHVSGVSDSLRLTQLSNNPLLMHPRCPLPLSCLRLPPSPPSSILHPFPLSFRAMWKLPITRNMRSANCWTWTWNMQNTGALNKGHAEMWLNASAGRKRPPQDQCNYESFTRRTFRTGQWPATGGGGGGGGCCQHYVPPTEPPF